MPHRSGPSRAARALARAARDRRIIGGAAATAGAALAAGVARELMTDDDGPGTDSPGAYRIKNGERASAAVLRIARGRLDRALEQLSSGLDKDPVTAVHEAGHALVARLMPKTDPVHKVTVIPRGRALGVTMQLPEGDRYSLDKERMLSTIAVLFGGRIAEEVFMHQMTTGASNDFERATSIARDMVTRYGMTDELGPMVYAENEGEVFLGRSVTKTTTMSEETMRKVDLVIRRIIDEQYAIARKLIEDNQDKMHAMASALLEWETIDSDQIDDIMSGKPPRPPKDWVPSPVKSSGNVPPVTPGNAPAAA